MKAPTKKQCVLVRCINGTQHPGLRFQVTVDPARVRDEYIRFGIGYDTGGRGDELTGWMKLTEWEIDYVFGDVDDAGNVTPET